MSLVSARPGIAGADIINQYTWPVRNPYFTGGGSLSAFAHAYIRFGFNLQLHAIRDAPGSHFHRDRDVGL